MQTPREKFSVTEVNFTMRSNFSALAGIIFFSLFFLLIQILNLPAAEKPLPLHPARYYKALPGGRVQCRLCPRGCILDEGQRGVCSVRKNSGGRLWTLVWGLPCAVNVDPIEKKPFFHFLPGTLSLSISTAGCNMRCLFCQNWQISQKSPEETSNMALPPAEVVKAALKTGCHSIAYTYTEPAIFFEYMLDTAREARKSGIRNVMHSCGYINPEPLRELCRYLDAADIDLKSIDSRFYANLTLGDVTPVLNCLKILKEEGVWIEITNLIIPGQNDDPATIRKMCRWIVDNLGPEVPLHLSRFYPTFRLKNLPPTPLETLEMARRVALREGLLFIYIGNVPGNKAENTTCPKCGKMLMERKGFEILRNEISGGKCRYCGRKIPGIFREEETGK